MHICHEEILAVVNGIQSIWPGIVAYINKVRAWFHGRKACEHVVVFHEDKENGPGTYSEEKVMNGCGDR